MSYQDFEKQYNQSKAMQDYAKKYVVSRLTDLKTRIDEQSDSRDVSFKLLLIKQMIDGEDPDEIRKYSIPNFLEKWKKGRSFPQLAVKTQKYLFDQLMPKAVEQGQICKVYYILHAYDLLVDAKSTDLMSNSRPNSNVTKSELLYRILYEIQKGSSLLAYEACVLEQMLALADHSSERLERFAKMALIEKKKYTEEGEKLLQDDVRREDLYKKLYAAWRQKKDDIISKIFYIITYCSDYWNDTEEHSENDAPNLAGKYIFSVKETPFHTNRLSNKNILGTRNNKIPTRPAVSENKNKINYQELNKVGGNRNALLQTSRILEKDQGITTIEKSSIDSGCYCF